MFRVITDIVDSDVKHQ